VSGYSGFSGEVGASGISGYSGFSGINGSAGASGFSGYSGQNGTNGASGISGYSGYSGSGISGFSGFSGYSGVQASLVGNLIYNAYIATAAQTSFTTTNTYTANKIQISVNGVIFVNGTDCTVSGGTTFTTLALASGDRVLAIYPI
jgi:hypothetical protein